MLRRLITVTLCTLALLAGGVVASSAAHAWTTTAQATVNVYERTGPSTSYPAIRMLQGGEIFYISCYKLGQSINGDPYWYYGKVNLTETVQGYVAGYYLTTGHDPSPYTGPCR